MSLDRVDRLVTIGFQWAIKDPRYVPWEIRFDELVAFIVSVRRDQISFRFPVLQLIIIFLLCSLAERTWPCTGANRV
jgi:hypothetical protein